MWVGQETAVEDQIDIEWQAVLVAEGHHMGPHHVLVGVDEELTNTFFELMHVERSGVDHDVGELLHWLEQGTLGFDRVAQRVAIAMGMATTRRLVAPDELMGRSVEEHKPGHRPPGVASSSRPSSNSLR